MGMANTNRKLEGAKNEVRGMKTVLTERFDRWFIDHTPFLVTNSGLIPSMSATREYKYLGIMFVTGGVKMHRSLWNDIFSEMELFQTELCSINSTL
jgi:hypothetical protein